MEIKNKIKVLTIFMLINIFYSAFAMQRTLSQEDVLCKDPRIEKELLDLPDEMVCNILVKRLTQIISQNNNIFNLFAKIDNCLKMLSNVNRKFKGLVQYIKDNRLSNKIVKDYFKDELDIYEQTKLNTEFANVLLGKYSKENEVKAVKLILAGADPNLLLTSPKLDEEEINNDPIISYTVLHEIDQSNEFSNLIDILIKYGANVDAKDSIGKTVLIYAVESLYIDKVNFWLSKGADVNTQYVEGKNILMYFLSNYLDIDCNQRGVSYQNCIDQGIELNNRLVQSIINSINESLKRIFNILLPCTKDLNTQDENEDTALTLACKLGNIEMVTSLIEAGSDLQDIMKVIDYYKHEKEQVMSVIEEGNLLPQDAARYERFRLILMDVFKCIQFLLNKLDVNYKDQKGNTLLTWSSFIGCLEVIEILINANVDLNMPDENGYTALMHAVEQGHLEVVKKLIEAGANLHKKNPQGFTALDLAINNSDISIVSLLSNK